MMLRCWRVADNSEVALVHIIMTRRSKSSWVRFPHQIIWKSFVSTTWGLSLQNVLQKFYLAIARFSLRQRPALIITRLKSYWVGQKHALHLCSVTVIIIILTSGYATWFTAGGAIRIALRQLWQTWSSLAMLRKTLHRTLWESRVS